MSSKNDFIPTNKDQFLAWLKNFVAMAIASVNHYGINQETIKLLQELADAYGVDISTELELLNKKLAQFKKTAADRKKVEDVVRKMAKGIKASLEYTEKVGRDFGIIAPDNPFDPKTFKSVISLRRVSSGVELTFTKSETEGVNIYRRKDGETDYQFMAYDLHSPYVDTKDMDGHFVYEYYVRGVINGQEIGLPSNSASIII